VTTADETNTTPQQDASRARRTGPPAGGGLLVPMLLVPALLFGIPWWTLVVGGQSWPVPVVVALSLLAVVAFAGLQLLMTFGHGRRHLDAAARIGDTTLGVAWVLFTWSVLGQVVEPALALAGVPDPLRSRIVAAAVLVVVLGLVVHGMVEALRLPRVRSRDVVLDRLGPGLDGLRVVVLADTHFGPLDRARWSAKVAGVVAGLRPDLLLHAGDLADGDVADRERQVRPVADLQAPLGRYSIVGNHEHFSGAAQWVEHMRGLGWQPLVNAHGIVERDGDRLVVAGIDDPTGIGRDLSGGPDLRAALAGTDPALPVLLLAHQPSQVRDAIAAGVDLQISGHTHGGQVWPFHLLVRLDQKQVSGLRRHGDRTQLYVSRGTGFWGPPLRIFAPSEITVLTLRAPH